MCLSMAVIQRACLNVKVFASIALPNAAVSCHQSWLIVSRVSSGRFSSLEGEGSDSSEHWNALIGCCAVEGATSTMLSDRPCPLILTKV